MLFSIIFEELIQYIFLSKALVTPVKPKIKALFVKECDLKVHQKIFLFDKFEFSKYGL